MTGSTADDEFPLAGTPVPDAHGQASICARLNRNCRTITSINTGQLDPVTQQASAPEAEPYRLNFPEKGTLMQALNQAEYCRLRAEQQRALAGRTSDADATSFHSALADRYLSLSREDEIFGTETDDLQR